MNKQKLVSIFVVVFVYLIGLVSGSLATKIKMKRSFHRSGYFTIRTGKKMEGRMIKRMSSKLDLTTKQQKQLKSIAEANRPQMEELKNNMKAEMKKLREKWNKDLKEILTEEQSVKFNELLEKRKNRSGKKHGNRKGLRRQGMRLNKENCTQ